MRTAYESVCHPSSVIAPWVLLATGGLLKSRVLCRWASRRPILITIYKKAVINRIIWLVAACNKIDGRRPFSTEGTPVGQLPVRARYRLRQNSATSAMAMTPMSRWPTRSRLFCG